MTEREFTFEVNCKRFEVELEERGAPAIDIEAAAGDSGGTQPRPERAGPGGDDGERSAAAADGEQVAAEMQGTILDVNVSEGDEVAAGDVLLVLEAMKMENDVVAESGGVVEKVAVGEGDSVDMGDLLVVID